MQSTKCWQSINGSACALRHAVHCNHLQVDVMGQVVSKAVAFVGQFARQGHHVIVSFNVYK